MTDYRTFTDKIWNVSSGEEVKNKSYDMVI